MTASLQDIKPDQVEALKKQSQAAYDEAIKSRQALVSQRPALQAALDQSVQRQSLCGCGCQQNICGYFCFQACGCGCGSSPENVYISSSLADIGPNAPQYGTKVTFSGYASGNGTSLDISNVYLQGTVPDAENLIGIQLALDLVINAGSIYLTLREGSRVLAVLVHPQQYAANINGQFSGSGYGTFSLA
ncbi:hypothetical protein [Burkholderia ubonensis]|uniref:hypothetical protein n=1 Tax=Burkholderia ubonensis TaxID=101571 RepID=UPI00075A985F|nr:hypothetical protein [Burkholderia ubonensis]KVC87904.1 hypothetical protein WI76_31460 [Burkholderia ubonensis]KVC99568.1 hypothetical protein WI77_00995 [Burkholderia ubonensis]KVD20294.1 hypothetical protein WI81_05570 [Burkholderia ubonensis]KVD40703.1 hypothetical protein WI84_07340 [Burkholderia ubonensis]KVG30619.1 hypothetical protein WJ29_20780 [Burkholderia ubonensis]